MNTPKTSDVLLGALALLDDPKRWTVGALARDASRLAVPPTDPTACTFCLSGAVQKVANGHFPAPLTIVGDVVRVWTPHGSAPEFNDARSTSIDDVHQVLMAAAFNALSAEQPAFPATKEKSC